MTPRQRLRRAQAVVMAALVARAALLGTAAGLVVLVAAAGADAAHPLSLDARRGVLPAAWLTAGVVLLAALWQARRALSLPAVALWVEERAPALQYALVTLAEAPAGAATPALARATEGVPWERQVARSVGRTLLAPAALALAAAAAWRALPTGSAVRVRAPVAGDALLAPPGGARSRPSRLVPLVATITAPSYAGGERSAVEEPTSLRGLAGSAVELRGRGDAGVTAALEERVVVAAASGDTWSVRLTMPSRPAALRLRDGPRERLVVLEPVADATPRAVLSQPGRDTVLRVALGRIPLAAEATDDLGVARAWFEYIVSSGSGESFTFRSGTIGSRVGGLGTRRLALAAGLVLDSLRLQPGDVVHLRAVAEDGNAVSGPGRGASETRTVRLARADEYDSVAVDAAPPPDVERSVLSQRMLIVLAEALERRRARLAPSAVVNESRRIGADQARLRRQVGEVIFARIGEGDGGEHAHAPGDGDEHELPEGKLSPEDLLRAADAATGRDATEALDFAAGESPVVAINRPLLEAYNAMWDAGRALDVGEPGRALPAMRLALAAIQRARQAERIYLRGRPPAVVVDLAKVRLQGADRGSPAPRRPRAAVDDARGRRAARLATVLGLLAADPAAAVDSLLLLRVDALADAPALAGALGEAAAALRAGRDARAALLRARRAVLGAPVLADSLGTWGRLP